MGVNDFISQFCQRGHEGYLPKKDASRFSTILKNIVNEDLPSRDSILTGQIRDLTNSHDLSIYIHSENIFCKPQDDFLLVGVLAPYWKNGLREICKTEAIYDQVEGFFHFAQQYVVRSRQINLIGSIALTYKRACDFRGHTLKYFTLNTDESVVDFKSQFPETPRKLSKNERLLTQLFNNMNALDPFINRIVFCYVRALKLDELGFAEEAITALDSVIDVAESFLCERIGIKEEDQRKTLSEFLGLSDNQKDRLSFLYEIRCYFGAHPAYSKWWDFGELYESEFEKLFEVVKKVVIKICELESKNRIVDDNPKKWSEWFCKNAMLLWDAVGFHRIPMAKYYFGEF
ncbi:MAG TPA: hypothetical protein PLN69_12495 [bacterium]|nr:hypothetical protein [bacterium]